MRGLGRVWLVLGRGKRKFERTQSRLGQILNVVARSGLGHRQECLCYWEATASDLREQSARMGRVSKSGVRARPRDPCGIFDMPCPYCGKRERCHAWSSEARGGYWKAGSVERRNQFSRTMWRENHLVARSARPTELMRRGGRRRPIWTDQSSCSGPKRLVSNAR
jgi:hypothetical protein